MEAGVYSVGDPQLITGVPLTTYPFIPTLVSNLLQM